MATALTALATTTLASSSATVVFSSISQSYRDLRLVVNWTGSAQTASNQYVQANGDTGANYPVVEMYGDGSGTGSNAFTSNGLYLQYLSSSVTNGLKTATMDIMDYSVTDKHKTALSRASNSNGTVDARACRWANTAAITSLTVVCTGTTFAAGSTFSLFGVSA